MIGELIRPLAVGLALLTTLLGVSCAESPADASTDALQGRLVITGSSTVAPLASEIGRRFEALHPGVRIDVQTGGSSRGMADVRRGIADIGMASRALTDAETDLTAHPIALDGVTIIVHADNPVARLTDTRIAAIYTGAVSNWREVGGADAPITVVHKADGRSTLEVFLRHFDLDAATVRPDIIVGDNQHGVLTVAGDPHAIGYVSIGAARSAADRGGTVRLLPLAGVEPTLEHVRTGVFPLSRPLNLLTHGDSGRLASAFIAFARSERVHDLIEAQHLVPIAE